MQHFGLFWVVLELTTFSLAPLIYFYRSKRFGNTSFWSRSDWSFY